MKLTRKRKWLLGTGAALLLTATPGFALFGLGDIVFDPTSYASLVSQLTTLDSQLTTLTSQYNMLKNNIAHFSFKQQWQTTLSALKNANVGNMFGETSGMSTALNSNSPGASLAGWQTATVSVNTDTSSYLGGQQIGNDRMAQLAMIEMSDSISPDCLTAVGQYRTARSQNASANQNLAGQQFDVTSATNSEVQQLNLLNAAQSQNLTEAQSQGGLQTCLAAQMTVANMQQRNAAAQDLNTAAFIQQQRSANDVSASNEGSTWANYLP